MTRDFGRCGIGFCWADRRISKALNKLQFERPALVQSRAIPPVLESKDVLVKARTG